MVVGLPRLALLVQILVNRAELFLDPGKTRFRTVRHTYAPGPGTSMNGPDWSVTTAPASRSVPKIDTPDTTTPATSAPVAWSIAAHVTMYPSGRSSSGGNDAVMAFDTRGPKPQTPSFRGQPTCSFGTSPLSRCRSLHVVGLCEGRR